MVWIIAFCVGGLISLGYFYSIHTGLSAIASAKSQSVAAPSVADEAALAKQRQIESQVNDIWKMLQEQPAQMLNKYPLGYVIFEITYTNQVFPRESAKALENYRFDWTVAGITQNTSDRIEIRLPDIYSQKTGQLLLSKVLTGGGKKVGPLGGAGWGNASGMVTELAEILSINDAGIVFVIGFQQQQALPTPKPPPTPAQQQPKAQLQPLESLTDGQRYSLKRNLSQLAGKEVRLVHVGNDPHTEIVFERLNDIFSDAGWKVQPITVGTASVVGANFPNTSYLTSSDVSNATVGEVFSIFSKIGLDLPLVPDAYVGPSISSKSDVVIVIH